MENCNNCAWYCHIDHKCYGLAQEMFKVPMVCRPTDKGCHRWEFDGLKDWERDPEALMTEVSKAS